VLVALLAPWAAAARPGPPSTRRIALRPPLDRRSSARHRRVRTRSPGASGLGAAPRVPARRPSPPAAAAMVIGRDLGGAGRLLHGMGRDRGHATHRHPDGVFRTSCWPSRSWRASGRACANAMIAIAIVGFSDLHAARGAASCSHCARREFVEAARALGATDPLILARHILPHLPLAADRGFQPRRGREDPRDGRAVLSRTRHSTADGGLGPGMLATGRQFVVLSPPRRAPAGSRDLRHRPGPQTWSATPSATSWTPRTPHPLKPGNRDQIDGFTFRPIEGRRRPQARAVLAPLWRSTRREDGGAGRGGGAGGVEADPFP